MSSFREHWLRVSRTARFVVAGDPATAPEAWFVLHGYGQAADRFATRFAALPGACRRDESEDDSEDEQRPAVSSHASNVRPDSRLVPEDLDPLTRAGDFVASLPEGQGEDARLPLACLSRDPELGPVSLEEPLADRDETLDQGIER